MGRLGLDRAVVRLVSERLAWGDPLGALATARRVLVMGCAASMGVALLLPSGPGVLLAEGLFDAPALGSLMALLAIWVVVYSLQHLLAEVFRGFGDLAWASLLRPVLRNLLLALFLLGWFLLRGEATLGAVVVMAMGASVGGTLVGLSVLPSRGREAGEPRELDEPRGRGPWREGEATPPGSILSLAWPIYLANLFLIPLGNADLWVLGALAPAAEVAVYGAALRLLAPMGMPLQMGNQVMAPLIARTYAEGRLAESEEALRTSAFILSIPGLLFLLVCVVAGGPLMGVVYGGDYARGGVVMAVLALGKMVNVWTGSCGLALTMTGHERTTLVMTLVTGVLATAGLLVLVPPHGMLGAALAISLAMSIHNLALVFLARERVGIWTHARFSPGAVRRLLFPSGKERREP